MHEATQARNQCSTALRKMPAKHGVILGSALGLVMGWALSAQALTDTEFQAVGGAVDSFITSQYSAADEGEGGFLITATALKARIKLGEGDDAANNPVLIDVFNDDYIPGTSLRFSSPAAVAGTPADPATADSVKSKISAHRKAGFSTDIVVYCLSGHTESPPIMALGAMSQAGYFDDAAGDPKPKVFGLKWGRGSWGVTTGPGKTLPNPGYGTTGKYTATFAVPGHNALASSGSLDTSCSGKTGPELVRCAAAWALSATGGNVAGGIVPWTTGDTGYLPVDLRESAAYTMADSAGAAYAIQGKLNALFNATGGAYDNLRKLDPSGTKTNVFANRTQHTAGMAAAGAAMLGYKTSFVKWGLPKWNNGSPPAWSEQYNGTSAGYGYTLTATPVDAAAPVISAVSAAPAATRVTIAWTTDEPATSQVLYSTVSGGTYTVVNDTVLHAAHSKVITGLTCSTTYYYQVGSYDGLANGAVSAEGNFTTGACGGTPTPEYTGDLNGDGAVDAADALKALRITAGIDTAGAAELTNGDCAPMSGGAPVPDGVIDLSDAVLILRKAAGLSAW